MRSTHLKIVMRKYRSFCIVILSSATDSFPHIDLEMEVIKKQIIFNRFVDYNIPRHHAEDN